MIISLVTDNMHQGLLYCVYCATVLLYTPYDPNEDLQESRTIEHHKYLINISRFAHSTIQQHEQKFKWQ